jgi:hypothetical protein
MPLYVSNVAGTFQPYRNGQNASSDFQPLLLGFFNRFADSF